MKVEVRERERERKKEKNKLQRDCSRNCVSSRTMRQKERANLFVTKSRMEDSNQSSLRRRGKGGERSNKVNVHEAMKLTFIKFSLYTVMRSKMNSK
jgi:hypothetical protein